MRLKALHLLHKCQTPRTALALSSLFAVTWLPFLVLCVGLLESWAKLEVPAVVIGTFALGGSVVGGPALYATLTSRGSVPLDNLLFTMIFLVAVGLLVGPTLLAFLWFGILKIPM
jgi:hypothetical protein